MHEIKTPREAKGMNQLKGIPTTYQYSTRKIIPMRTHANLHHCHSLRCARDVARIDRKLWEPKVSELLNDVEKQRITINNRFYKTLWQVKVLLDESSQREEKLQTTKEEMEATNEELEATNEELQATTEELEIVYKNRQIPMDSMLDILMTTDLSGVITEVNKATERISGYSRKELIGQPFTQFFTAPEMAQAGIEMAAREEDVSNYDLTMVAKDGHEVEVSYSAVVLRDSEGRVSGILGSARDITTRKRTEKKLQTLTNKLEIVYKNRQIPMDSMLDILMTTDLSGVITEVNKATERISGYSRKELIGQPFTQFFTAPEMAQAGIEMAAREEDVSNYDLTLVAKDGHKVEVSYSAVVLRDSEGRVSGILGSARNITTRKIADDKLKETLLDLERSNAELVQFAYIASHDLQEPLRMVSNFVQLLAKRYTGKLDADADEFIKNAVEGTTRMQEMITALLEYSRVGSCVNPLKTTDYSVVFDHAVNNLRVAINESGALITYDKLPTVPADESQMIQLLQNLIGNSIKFNSNVPPRIHLSAAKHDNEWVFSVHDNGIGIEQQYFERIFTIFQRLHSKAEFSGSGIGLAICKKIVERHDGRIGVESQIGKGSTFFFSIPDRGGK